MLNQYLCLSDLLGGLCEDAKKGRTWRLYTILLELSAGNNLHCSIWNGLKGLERKETGFGG